MTDLNSLKISTPGVKTFVSENWVSLIMFAVAAVGVTSILSGVSQHREDVQTVSIQNAGCIYLESSKLGEGQHYMICNGQITLKRVADGEQTDPEQALEEAIPTEAATAPAENKTAPPPTK
jgi:hypothetical protein